MAKRAPALRNMNNVDRFILSVVFTVLDLTDSDDYEDDPYVHVHYIC